LKHLPSLEPSLTLSRPTIRSGDPVQINKKTVVLVSLLLTYSVSASAGLTSDGILDQVITKFADSASKWAETIRLHAENLFFLLAPIGLVLTFLGTSQSAAKTDFSDFTIPLLQYSFYGGISLWFMEKGPEYAMSIIDSMRIIGGEASGTGKELAVTSIVNMGFDIWHLTVKNLSGWSPIQSFVSVVLSLGILVVLTLIAVNTMLLLISGWILAYAGSIVLGFGAISQTRDIMINYLKTVIAFGLQLMTMTLLIGIGNDLLTSFYSDMDRGTLNAEEMGVLLVACIALLFLVAKVPPMIGGIISGASISGGGIGGFGGGAAITGAALAQAAIAAGGSAMLSGAANAAGVADALNAASTIPEGDNLTNNDGPIRSGKNTTSGAGTTLEQVMGDNNTGWQSNNSNPQGTSKLSNIASRLTQGVSDVAQTKASDMKAQFQERVSQTIPGQVSEAIKGNDAAYNSAIGADNSLSAGTEQAFDPESEIASFVNKGKK